MHWYIVQDFMGGSATSFLQSFISAVVKVWYVDDLGQGSSTYSRPRTPKLMERWSRDPLLTYCIKLSFILNCPALNRRSRQRKALSCCAFIQIKYIKMSQPVQMCQVCALLFSYIQYYCVAPVDYLLMCAPPLFLGVHERHTNTHTLATIEMDLFRLEIGSKVSM